jgi:hypothetical protein
MAHPDPRCYGATQCTLATSRELNVLLMKGDVYENLFIHVFLNNKFPEE